MPCCLCIVLPHFPCHHLTFFVLQSCHSDQLLAGRPCVSTWLALSLSYTHTHTLRCHLDCGCGGFTSSPCTSYAPFKWKYAWSRVSFPARSQCCNGDVDGGWVLIFVSATESACMKTGSLLHVSAETDNRLMFSASESEENRCTSHCACQQWSNYAPRRLSRPLLLNLTLLCAGNICLSWQGALVPGRFKCFSHSLTLFKG